MDCRGDELIQHNRTSTQAVPFQYLINEQAKSILALQELQNEVGALLEFRDLVMDTFPHLRQKQVSSPEPSSGSQGVGSGESRWEPGVRVRRKLGSSSGWIAGGGGGLATAAAVATVPRSRSNSHGKGPKSGEPATTSVGTVQDSGFCTESKDSSSTSSRTTTKNCCKDEDELWSLLEVIQDKGTKLKLEVEFLQSRLLDDENLQRRRWRKQRLRRCRSLDDLLSEDCKRSASCDDGKRLSPSIADDYCNYNVFRAHVTDLKRERDALLDRVTEMEAESLSNAAQIHRLLTELKLVVCENKELEERLCGGKPSSAATTLRKSSSHNGVGFAPVQPESSTGPSSSSAGRDAYYTPSQHSACNLSSIELCKQCSSSYTDTDDDRHRSRMLLVRPSDPISRNLEGQAPSLLPTVDIGSPTFAKRLGLLDGIVSSPGDRIGKPIPGCGTAPGTPLPKRTLAAILKTFNPIELQRHLITVSYENKNLVRQVETLNKSKCDISNELNKSKEDNEELKFQLEEKRIELEGTMARVRLLQLHQEQHQHGSVTEQSGATGITTTATNQWLDLVPSNPILPQIALPGTPSAAVVTSSHHLQNHHNHRHHQDENGGDGSSSTESAHQARSGGRHSQPSKIPVVKPSYSVSRPPSSYREHHHTPRDPYPSWNKCKSDQSLPRNWDPIHNKSNGGSGSSIGSGGKQRGSNKQDSLQDYNGHAGKHLHHRARKDSGSGGVASLTRARSQNHHQRAATAAANSAIKERTGGTITAVVASQSTVDDTNKQPPKIIYRRRSLSRQTRSLIDNKKPVLPAVDEVQEPPDSMATAAARLRDRDDGDQDRVFQNGDCDGRRIFQDDDDRLLQDDDDDDEELFFDSIESSLATSASSRRPPPECDSIDLSHPDSPLPTG